MKHTFLSLAAMTAILCTSCNKEADTIPASPSEDSANPVAISLSLSSLTAQTRAFFDDSAALESWEKELHKATILVIETDGGDVIARKDLTASELQQGRATIADPDFTEGGYVAVAAVANFDVPQDITNLGQFATLFSSFSVAEYNGTFSEVAYGAKRSGGFLMSAEDGDVLAVGVNSFDLNLVGAVAKVAFDLSLDDSFDSNYSGSLRVNSISVSNTPLRVSNNDEEFTHTQQSSQSGEHYRNLFYLLRSAPRFVVDATYDTDGNFSTTADQKSVQYDLNLKDDYGNPLTLEDHVYYRITGKIQGLGGSDPASCEVTIEVSDWEEIEEFDFEV